METNDVKCFWEKIIWKYRFNSRKERCGLDGITTPTNLISEGGRAKGSSLSLVVLFLVHFTDYFGYTIRLGS
jgi:hypothetical protein